MEGSVSKSTTDGICTITFYHPQSNSMPGELLNLLANTIEQAGKEEDSKVIVLESQGEKSFCAGASFDELVAINDFETGKKFFSGFAKVINAMRKAPKFIIAKVQGKAVGGGVGIASAADYTLAHTSADVKLSELAVGIGPFVVGPAVERKIGTSKFASLSINATQWQNSNWAFQAGLYANVFSTHEELNTEVKKLAETLSKSNPQAMEMLKKVFWQGTENWDTLLLDRAEMSGTLVLSDFTKNAIAKFKAKA
jgi:methylglutaconyl-CoA hydratase